MEKAEVTGTALHNDTLIMEAGSTWLMAGDSITASDRDIAKPDDLGRGFVSLVDGMLAACHPARKIAVVNRGIPGDTVRDLATRWQRDVLDPNPDWLSVCIGINDVWQQFDGKHIGQAHVTLAEYERTLDSLLASARALLKGLVLLTPYFIQPRGEPMREMMDEYGAAVGRLARKHGAILVDTQAAFDLAAEKLPVERFAWDRAHLTTAGNIVLARALLSSIGFQWRQS